MIAARLPDTAPDADAPPPVLLPYQQRWIADSSPLKVIEKSRRTGLTWGEAADNVLTAAAGKASGGMNVYYIAYNEDMTIEYIQACAMWARAFNSAASAIESGFWDEAEEDKHIKTFTIRFPSSGHRIVALSSRPANLRGRQGIIVIDEAAFHAKLSELLKAALAMLIWGGRVRVISTHDGEGNPFNELVREIRAGKRRGSVQRITFGEAVAEGLYRRVCLRLGRDWSAADEAEWAAGVYDFYGAGAAEELDCIPSQGSGAYFTRLLIESCQDDTVPILRWQQPPEFVTAPDRLAITAAWIAEHLAPVVRALPGKRSVYGQDFGRSGDLSVIWVLQEIARDRWRCGFAVELRNLPFDVQASIRDYLLDELPLLSAAKFDARGNGQSHAEGALQKKGALIVECVMFTAAWYAEHFPKYRAAFEDRTLIAPPGEDVIADHRRVVLKAGRPGIDNGHDKGSDGGQRHGDSAVAGVLAWAGTLRPPVEIDYIPVPKRPTVTTGDTDDDDLHDPERRSDW